MQRRSRPHPFALEPAKSPPIRWRLTLVCIGIALIAAAFVPDLGRRWMASRLVQQLDQLPADQQQARLALLADLGDTGISVLVTKMLDSENPLALSAYRVLSDVQDEWATRYPDRSDHLHYALISAMEARASSIPSDRRAWVEQLAGQVLMDTLQSDTGKGQAAYAAAVRLLAQCNPASSHPSREPQRPTLRIATRPNNEPMLSPPPPALPEADSNAPSTVDANGYGSLSNLPSAQVVPPAQLVPSSLSFRLSPITLKENSKDTFQQQSLGTMVSSMPNVPVVVASLAPYQTRELIDLLHGSPADLMKSVREELQRRGFNEAAIIAAQQMASADTRQRLRLIETIAQRNDIDPRPFLLWLSEDPDRQVRVAAINLLATINDPLIRRALQEQLNVETDPVVASQLRVAVASSPKSPFAPRK